MDYKTKYYKYNAKYLNLKHRDCMDCTFMEKPLQDQVGGKLFQKKQKLYIVATISQPKLKKITKEITNIILGKNIKPYRAPHITLLNLIINGENDANVIFQDEKFYNQIKDNYTETIADKSNPLILSAKPFPQDYSFPGFMPKYFIKNYKALDPKKIL